MKPVRLGLVGIGGFGANHLRSLQRLRQDGLIELVAIADPALDRHEQTTAALREEGVFCYVDFLEMLAHGPDLEAVILCTPIPLHKEMAVAALHRGLYVYLEKPPVILSSDLHELIQLDPHKRTAVGFIGVSQPVVRRTKALIAEGAIGELQAVWIAASWPRPSWYYQRSDWAGKLAVGSKAAFDGPATNALSHYAHLASYLAGDTVDGHANIHWLEAELYRARPIESYDTCCQKGEFVNGIKYSLAFTHACQHRTDVEVRLVGSRRTVSLNIGRTSVRSDLVDELDDLTFILDINLRNFVEGIRKGTRFFTTLEDCIPFLNLVSGMWFSSGGIHSVDPCHASTWNEEPDTLFHIAEIESAIGGSLNGTTFAEQGYPWTVKPMRVFANQFPSFDLNAALSAIVHQVPVATTDDL